MSLEHYIKQNKQLGEKNQEFAILWVKKRQGQYFICPTCKGKGFNRKFIKHCIRCDGSGYVDWIRLIRRRNANSNI